MMTLDLAPGRWRHGLEPALRVQLRVPPDGTHGDASEAQKRAPAADGLAGAASRQGGSLPIGDRYYTSREVDQPARPISRAPLVFPELAYISRMAGTVTARVFISEEGEVVSVDIVGARPRRGVFEQAAIAALRQVRYEPARLAGQRVKSQKLIEVRFDPYENAPTR